MHSSSCACCEVQEQGCEMIRMGFPTRPSSEIAELVHATRDKTVFARTAYMCPQCQAKNAELPVDCAVCGLKLVLAPHLARSFHHLFPVPRFVESLLRLWESDYILYGGHRKNRPKTTVMIVSEWCFSFSYYSVVMDILFQTRLSHILHRDFTANYPDLGKLPQRDAQKMRPIQLDYPPAGCFDFLAKAVIPRYESLAPPPRVNHSERLHSTRPRRPCYDTSLGNDSWSLQQGPRDDSSHSSTNCAANPK